MSISSVDDRWSKHLPHELVDMIVKRLGLVDSKTFAAVCSSWRSVTMASQWLATQFPCILQSLPYEDCSAGTSCYSLYSPGEDRAANNLKFPKEIVDRDGMAPYCSGCFGSWLIIAEHSRQPKKAKSYFFNPVSGARIALPPHTNRSFFVRDDETGWNEKVVVKTVASSDPTDPNCIVAALTLHAHKLAFCRPNDASWTLQYRPDSPEEGGFGLTDLHFHEGELYATVGRMIDAVLMFDPVEVLSQSQCGSDEANAFKGKLLLVSPLQFHTRSMHNPSFSLITSFSGEMALVLKNERILRKRNYREVSFLVLKGKVDKTLHIGGSAGYCDWEEVNNLGEQAIFIGDIGAKTLIAMSKPTNSMPVIDKLGGLGSGNCIYFTDEEDDNIGVYNLADGTLKYQLTGGLQQAHSKVWFTPKLS
ncbi:hypothetical protein ABKV19_012390 [Rosa sericea]